MPELPSPPESEANTSVGAGGSVPGVGMGSHLRRRLGAWLGSASPHKWIQSAVVVLTAGWTMYTFFYTDVLIPSWQPAHLNLEATLTPVAGRETGAEGSEGMEMTLTIKATNDSSRRVYPLANYWLLTGIERKPQPEKEREEGPFSQRADRTLRQLSLQHAERTVDALPGAVLAMGRILDDDFIDPGASRPRTILVRIPKEYDSVELTAILPLLSKPPSPSLFGNNRRLEWGLNDSSMQPAPMLCEEGDPQSPSRESGCGFADAQEIANKLTRFDQRHSSMDLTMQIALPHELSNQ